MSQFMHSFGVHTVNLMINMLYTLDRIRDQALLLAIRPLKVGSAKLSRCYYQYAPSKQYVDLRYVCNVVLR